jgi:hypothetical protein
MFRTYYEKMACDDIFPFRLSTVTLEDFFEKRPANRPQVVTKPIAEPEALICGVLLFDLHGVGGGPSGKTCSGAPCASGCTV